MAVLAKSFQLQNEHAVLELDRVLDVAPDALDGHRLGLEAAHQERVDKIVAKTEQLMDRLEDAADFAMDNVVLHWRASKAIVDSVNKVGDSLDEFRAPFSIEPQHEAKEAPRWREAIKDPQQLRNAEAEARPKVLAAGGTVLSIAATALLRSLSGGDEAGEES